jgi:hypothetical protein
VKIKWWVNSSRSGIKDSGLEICDPVFPKVKQGSRGKKICSEGKFFKGVTNY